MGAAVTLALGASLAWGVADFVGPWQGRTLGALRVLLWAQLAGAAALALVVAARGEGPDGAGVLWAAPAALSGTLGLYAYYRGTATGTMAVVAPIAGASAIVPVVFGLATGDRPSAAQLAGSACALAGVALAAQEHQAEGRRLAAGAGLALLAAVGFGFYFPPMHAAGSVDAWWSSLVFRLTSAGLVAATVAARRPPLALAGPRLAVVAAVGCGDTLGNLLFAAASGRGLVSLTSVLASLYPVVTVVLAALVLRERVSRSQLAGIALTLAGVGLISA
ncbi:MAG TPA: EamA family transporter [Gaiellaceae bacterium]|nr:EamA family transporter [Gaiellaceae bacterium]